MKQRLLQCVAAMVALLHLDADDKDQIAKLKGQVRDLQDQLSLSPDETQQITQAMNMFAAATAPDAETTADVTAIKPAPNQSAEAIPGSVAEASPQDVAQAAARIEPPPPIGPVTTDQPTTGPSKDGNGGQTAAAPAPTSE
jgi:hypothetical protein